MRGDGFAVSRAPERNPRAALAHGPREWWVQFEALRTLAVWAGTEEGDSLAPTLVAQWAFVRDRVLDHADGGVFWSCPSDFPVWARRARAHARRKGDAWKDASHETDALLEAIAVLRGAPASTR